MKSSDSLFLQKKNRVLTLFFAKKNKESFNFLFCKKKKRVLTILAIHSIRNETDPIVPFSSIPILMPIVPTHYSNSHPNPNAQSYTHPNTHCPIPMPIDHCQKREHLKRRQITDRKSTRLNS